MILLDIQQVIDVINADERFYFHGKGNNYGIWSTSPEGAEVPLFIDLYKPIAQKGYGGVRITILGSNDAGIEILITIYVPSHCEWDTFFEGFVESIDDFKAVFRMLGLNK